MTKSRVDIPSVLFNLYCQLSTARAQYFLSNANLRTLKVPVSCLQEIIHIIGTITTADAAKNSSTNSGSEKRFNISITTGQTYLTLSILGLYLIF